MLWPLFIDDGDPAHNPDFPMGCPPMVGFPLVQLLPSDVDIFSTFAVVQKLICVGVILAASINVTPEIVAGTVQIELLPDAVQVKAPEPGHEVCVPFVVQMNDWYATDTPLLGPTGTP